MELPKDLANGASGANGVHGAKAAVLDSSSRTNGNHNAHGPTKVGLTSPLIDDHPAPLRIVVVGAGIGGLSAALSLRRNGHQVEVSLRIIFSQKKKMKTVWARVDSVPPPSPHQLYEQSRFANETGAAVHLAPNSNGVLRRWGIYAEEFGAVPTERVQERLSSGEIMKDVDCTVPNKMWQHPWLLSHRVNLHEKLKTLATSPEGVGTPAKLHTSSKVTRFDPEQGEVSLEDGTTVTGDVILGADGSYVSHFSWDFSGLPGRTGNGSPSSSPSQERALKMQNYSAPARLHSDSCYREKFALVTRSPNPSQRSRAGS